MNLALLGVLSDCGGLSLHERNIILNTDILR
ncbi:hypothetical protein DOFOFD_07430 [Acetobacteraceae bacterium EV16P]|uniref:Uncharacterized protein n=1 Tax=Sorlinia euscelidii TaxID=3081148 RepID=A0ABU7U2Z1_9PROT